MPRALALALVSCALVAGCGGDDENGGRTETATTPTATSPPTTATDPAPAPPATTPQPAPSPPAGGDPGGSGGTTAPAPAPTPPADSPENDRPPVPGSPQDRFERECEQNPEACR